MARPKGWKRAGDGAYTKMILCLVFRVEKNWIGTETTWKLTLDGEVVASHCSNLSHAGSMAYGHAEKLIEDKTRNAIRGRMRLVQGGKK